MSEVLAINPVSLPHLRPSTPQDHIKVCICRHIAASTLAYIVSDIDTERQRTTIAIALAIDASANSIIRRDIAAETASTIKQQITHKQYQQYKPSFATALVLKEQSELFIVDTLQSRDTVKVAVWTRWHSMATIWSSRIAAESLEDDQHWSCLACPFIWSIASCQRTHDGFTRGEKEACNYHTAWPIRLPCAAS